MSKPIEKGPQKSASPGDDFSFDDYARSRREGAFISPCGTEGCQWDGFPEPPDAPADEPREE